MPALQILMEPTGPLPRHVTVEEYLAFEAKSAVKTEYMNGRIYCQGVPFDPDTEGIEETLWAMAGAMPEHDRVLINFILVVGSQLRGKPCRLHSSDQRIELNDGEKYVYPDVTASCGTPRYDMTLKPPVLENPLVVVEVLSPSTRKYDLTTKRRHTVSTRPSRTLCSSRRIAFSCCTTLDTIISIGSPQSTMRSRKPFV